MTGTHEHETQSGSPRVPNGAEPAHETGQSMKLRYELRDSHYEDDPSMRKCGRFTSLVRAERELAQSIPPGRFYLFDRQTNTRL